MFDVYVVILFAAFVILLTIRNRVKIRELYLNFNSDFPVYLISLDKDIERRQLLYQIVTPNVVYSVDGRKLDRNTLLYSDTLDPNNKLTIGEIGCYLSHCNILKKISQDTQSKVSLVLEDDATFDYKQVQDKINEIVDNFKEDWDIIALGHKYFVPSEASKTVELGDSKFVEINYMHGTHGLLVNNALGKRYTNLFPMSEPYDVVLPKKLKTFVLLPEIIHLNESVTGVSNTQGIRD